MGALLQSSVYEIILRSYTVLLKGCSLPPLGWQKGCIPTLHCMAVDVLGSWLPHGWTPETHSLGCW